MKIKKVLSLALLFGFAIPVVALPPRCGDRCSCTAPCEWNCSFFAGGTITCGEFGLCVGADFCP